MKTTTAKEQYVYTVVDRTQVILKDGKAESLTEFCSVRGFNVLQSFKGMAVIEDNNSGARFGVTWVLATPQE